MTYSIKAMIMNSKEISHFVRNDGVSPSSGGLKINVLKILPPKSPSKGGIQKIFDSLPRVNHTQWGKIKFNAH